MAVAAVFPLAWETVQAKELPAVQVAIVPVTVISVGQAPPVIIVFNESQSTVFFTSVSPALLI